MYLYEYACMQVCRYGSTKLCKHMCHTHLAWLRARGSLWDCQNCRPDLGLKKPPDDRARTTKDQLLRELKFPELITLLIARSTFAPGRFESEIKPKSTETQLFAYNGSPRWELAREAHRAAAARAAMGARCGSRNGHPYWEPHGNPKLVAPP